MTQDTMRQERGAQAQGGSVHQNLGGKSRFIGGTLEFQRQLKNLNTVNTNSYIKYDTESSPFSMRRQKGIDNIQIRYPKDTQ
jgi:hypothetical protein